MAAAVFCTTLVTHCLSSSAPHLLHIACHHFFISQTISVFISHCALARWSVCLFLKRVFMAVLQIAILFGVGSHVVTLYFGQKVISRQTVGNLKATPPHPIYGPFFLCPEPSVYLEEYLCSTVLRHAKCNVYCTLSFPVTVLPSQ